MKKAEAQAVYNMLILEKPVTPEREAVWMRALRGLDAEIATRAAAELGRVGEVATPARFGAEIERQQATQARAVNVLGNLPLDLPEWVQRWGALRGAGDFTILPEQEPGYETIALYEPSYALDG